jgi:hypothetical protein
MIWIGKRQIGPVFFNEISQLDFVEEWKRRIFRRATVAWEGRIEEEILPSQSRPDLPFSNPDQGDAR